MHPRERTSNIILSIDLGTTTIGSVALDADSGAVVDLRTVANTANGSNQTPDQHEQDACLIVKIAKTQLAETVKSLQKNFSRAMCIRAVTVTGQMHGIVLVDSDNRPASGLLTWRDQRAKGARAVLELSRNAVISKRCGCRLQPGYGFATLHQLILEDKRLSRYLEAGEIRICGIADLLVAALCDVLVTDITMAASWGGLNLQSRFWDRGILENLQIPPGALPPLRQPAEPLRRISSGVADELGIDCGAVVCAGIGDHQASVLACRPIGRRSCVVNIGTGSQVSVIIEQLTKIAGLETRPLFGTRAMVTGTGLCGGWSYDYLADFLTSVLTETTPRKPPKELIYRVMNEAGSKAPTNANGLVVDPRFLGSRHKEGVRGSISGIDANNLTPGNLVRAMANGIVGELHAYYALTGQETKTLYATGNAIRLSPLLIEAIVDRWGVQPEILPHTEEAAYGAACAAAVQLGSQQEQWLFDAK